MGTRQGRVERRRLKRKKHHRRQRVVQIRQAQRLAGDAQPLYASVINREWRENGQASIFIARSLGPGTVTMAAFLVDLWAMGLKDAWGRTTIPTSEFDDTVKRMDDEVGTSPVDIGTVKHVVYGGIALARDLGFRLPRRYQRWTALLGPLPDDESPDMSLFLNNGRIHLVCSQRDLEERLIGATPQAFLARDDVEFVIGDDDFTLVDEEAEDGAAWLDELGEHMLEQVQRWCFSHGQQPHPLLGEVINAALEAAAQGTPPDLDDPADIEALPERFGETAGENVAAFVSASCRDAPASLDTAMAQLGAFMQAHDTPEQFAAALSPADE